MSTDASNHSPALFPDMVIEPQVTIQIPDTIEDVEGRLARLGGGINAGGWATAAVVYAWAEPDQGARSDLGRNGPKLTFTGFAQRNIRGLNKRHTVAKYWAAWQKAIENDWAEPAVIGEPVRLPVEDFKLSKGSGDPDGDEWFTPKWLFDALGLVFSIDVCGPADRTYVTVPCESYYTEDDDGLAQPWDGLVWCNPPYSTPEDWALKMVGHNNGLLLSHVPMNAAWAVAVWQNCTGIRLFQAMDFLRPDGTEQRPGYWLMLAAFGPVAADALRGMVIPDGLRPGRIPSPFWTST